ncbi:MAG TPA: hypothetical protein VH253_16630 [Phycisphaerae bacterium]|nr:hypothetical protein [Phycisphaerae bacterium]
MVRALCALFPLSALLLAGAAPATAPATAPVAHAATAPADWPTWVIDLPDKKVSVTVSYPAGWKNTRDASGKPLLTPPDAQAAADQPHWTFDIKTDPQNRSAAQLQGQYAKALEATGRKVLTSESLDLPNGRKAAAITSSLAADGQTLTVRNTLIPLGDGRLIITTESAGEGSWKNVADNFAKVTASIQVTILPVP